MNKRNLLILSIALIISFITSGCSGTFLNRPPQDRPEAGTFFTTAHSLEVYTNSFYSMLPTWTLYKKDAASDNIVPINPSPRVKGTRKPPVATGSGGWNWSALRNINYFLAHYKTVKDKSARQKYSGIAKFFRAYFYFKKIKRFGDVPWYSKVLKANSKGLYKPRDPRKMVMDSVLSDIDYAIKYIPAQIKLYRITKYTAMILKARICLYGGTYREYHHLGDYKSLLQQAAKASGRLIQSGAYKLFTKGGPNRAYLNLFARTNQTTTGTILARNYDQTHKHDLAYFMTSPTQGRWGMTQEMVDTYLMKDGKPFTSLPNYKTMTFYQEMQNRDPRLTQTTAGPNYIPYGSNKPIPVNLNISTTGYRIIKGLPTLDQWEAHVSHSSYNDIIIFRYGEALLIYAEAKAELGTLTQHDLDISINKLRDRVGMPHMHLAYQNSHSHPFLEKLYPNVSGPNKGVILAIRRERRVELFNEGHRWSDLMRWAVGEDLEKPMVGIYFPHLGGYDFNHDGKIDVYLYNGNASNVPKDVPNVINVQQRHLTNGTSGNLDPFPEGGHFVAPKDYLYPIPLEDLALNPNLKQNPGWPTGK